MLPRFLIGPATTLIAALSLPAAASATVFTADYDRFGVSSTYDSKNEAYGMRFTPGKGKDGFWLVVSDGPNPKTHVNEYAILYGDLTTNRITAYTYDGKNGPNSYRSGTFLGSYDNAFRDVGGGAVSFNLDVSDINMAFGSADWDGIQLGRKAGIWFHQSTGSQFEYGADGGVLSYSFGGQMWLDDANDLTRKTRSPGCGEGSKKSGSFNPCKPTQVTPPSGGSSGGRIPAPGGLALLLVGLLGLRLFRR